MSALQKIALTPLVALFGSGLASASDSKLLPAIDWRNPANDNGYVKIVDRSASDGDTMRLYDRIAECVTESAFEVSKSYAITLDGVSEQEPQNLQLNLKLEIEKYCGQIYWIYGRGHWKRTFQPDWRILISSVRRSVYIKEFPKLPFFSSGNSEVLDYRLMDPGRPYYRRLLDCLVESNPSAADRAIRAKYGSTEERGAILDLVAQLPACKTMNHGFDFDRWNFRIALNDSLFAHAFGLLTQGERWPKEPRNRCLEWPTLKDEACQ